MKGARKRISQWEYEALKEGIRQKASQRNDKEYDRHRGLGTSGIDQARSGDPRG